MASQSSSGFVTLDGLPVYYELHGGPPHGAAVPVVLLHGGAMTIETAFAGVIPRFAATRPVIAIELQGHGHTGDRPGPMSLERMCDDVAGVLAQLGVARADLFGLSLGGMAATGVAIRHPDRVRALVPLGAGFTLDGMRPEILALQRGEAAEPDPAIVPLLPTEAEFAAWRASFARSAPDPAAFDAILARLNAMLTGWRGWTAAELGAIRAATLIVVGDNDFIRVDHAAAMKASIPGAALAVLPQTEHMTLLGRLDWILPMMGARLQGVG
jgi:pimeloyl-ACP methyl ester carboxylesterase